MRLPPQGSAPKPGRKSKEKQTEKKEKRKNSSKKRKINEITIRNKNKTKPGEAAPTARNQRSAQSCGPPLPPIALGRRIKLSKKNKERVKTSQNKSNEPAAPPRGAAILGKQKTKRFGANRKRGPEAPDFGIIAHAPKPPNPENTKRPASRAKGRGEKKPPEEQANAATSVRSEGDQTGCSLALLSLSAAHFHCVPLKPLCRAPAKRSIRRQECHAAAAPLKRAAADRRPAPRAKRRRLPQSRSRKKEGKKEGGKREEGGKKGEKREEIKKTAACRGGYLGVAGSSSAAKIRGALSRRGG